MKCLICENLYPPNYKECPICKNHLVPEKFAPQVEEIKEMQNFEFIEPFVVDGDIDDFGSM